MTDLVSGEPGVQAVLIEVNASQLLIVDRDLPAGAGVARSRVADHDDSVIIGEIRGLLGGDSLEAFLYKISTITWSRRPKDPRYDFRDKFGGIIRDIVKVIDNVSIADARERQELTNVGIYP
jgi:hypothetical protein